DYRQSPGAAPSPVETGHGCLAVSGGKLFSGFSPAPIDILTLLSLSTRIDAYYDTHLARLTTRRV
ncbi:MAG: hypothetical protein AB1798_22690, partial [Spirochaetota bacterium]